MRRGRLHGRCHHLSSSRTEDDAVLLATVRSTGHALPGRLLRCLRNASPPRWRHSVGTRGLRRPDRRVASGRWRRAVRTPRSSSTPTPCGCYRRCGAGCESASSRTATPSPTAGLVFPFDFEVYSEWANCAMPDAAIFRLACETAGCRAGELVHVGDSLREDVLAARALPSARRCGCGGSGGRVMRQPGPVIGSLGELPGCWSERRGRERRGRLPSRYGRRYPWRRTSSPCQVATGIQPAG